MDAARRARLLAALAPTVVEAAAACETFGIVLTQRQTETAAALTDNPSLALDPELFDQCLVRALTTREEFDALIAGEIALADLYLAAACVRGEPPALRRFDLLCGPELDRAISRSPKLGWTKPEFRQFVAVRLFVGPEGRAAKLLSYRGRGSLRAWVRVAAARMIIDLSRRRAQPSAGDDALLDHLRADEDPELDYLRQAYGPLLRGAFERAVAALTVRQRNLLRQHYLHELPVDALATIYAVHRSTLYVWLEQARAALLEHARAALAAGVPDDRLESVIALLGSQLQVSVRRMLDSQLEADEA